MSQEVSLKQKKELALNFATGLSIQNPENFVQNAMLLMSDPETAKYATMDVLNCLLKAEQWGVSLVKKEAYLYPTRVNNGNDYIDKPLLVVDYKFEIQEVFNTGQCQQLSIIPVIDGDIITRSLNGHEWAPCDKVDGVVIGYYAYYESKAGMRIGVYMSKEQILAKLPENNRNANYKGSDSKSEWLFKKGVFRQLKKQIPNTVIRDYSKLEEYEDLQPGELPVNKNAAKSLPPAELLPPVEDELY